MYFNNKDMLMVQCFDINMELIPFAGTYLQIMIYLSFIGEIPAWLIDFSNHMSKYFIHEDFDIIFDLSPPWLKTLINFKNVIIKINPYLTNEIYYKPEGIYYKKIYKKYYRCV